MDVKEELTHPETRARWNHVGNWNRRIHIPGVWSGHVKDIPPHGVEALIKQGRKDFVEINKQNQAGVQVDSKVKGSVVEASKDADKK